MYSSIQVLVMLIVLPRLAREGSRLSNYIGSIQNSSASVYIPYATAEMVLHALANTVRIEGSSQILWICYSRKDVIVTLIFLKMYSPKSIVVLVIL
ncbi:uncharacterized protein BT62DRAFT_687383 [Guyanagaster necrorhizus]|uniref:NADH dehydrogenase subunit 4 n=1 Tax=Guyanagaster necrorhizus TaxID=856835 RepID=A0A9P7VF91_9AGAR|nr:uncharacterized protein BT62DRAFT_687383 [Guyanagaster necrorhizus MCA 3950]KAG7439858.1 hypothetical protein BT62DRAFT_687383 [Guyanagaster necrorhizus MCA 3950]